MPISKLRLLPMLAALIALLTAPAADAQSQPPVTTRGAPVPTTHVLAIGKIARADAMAEIQPIMPKEVRDTVALYLNGRIEQWWVRKDAQGVVFLLNAKDADEARALLADLPLVKGGYLAFDLMPLGPLRPLQYLTDDAAN